MAWAEFQVDMRATSHFFSTAAMTVVALLPAYYFFPPE